MAGITDGSESESSDMTIQERIARAIEAKADKLEMALVEPDADPDDYFEPVSDLPILVRILGPKIAGLREAARIARKTPDHGWIAVGDRLPDEYASVLVHASITREFDSKQEKYITIGSHRDGKWTDCCGWQIDVYEWQPLPKTPPSRGGDQ